MKGGGLGTPATRASILDTLLRRGYITRTKKTLAPTEAGVNLVTSINTPALLEPELTAEWERRLQSIAEGREDPKVFIAHIRSWVTELAQRLPNGPRIHVPEGPNSKRGRTATRRQPSRSARSSSAHSSGSNEGSSVGSWRASAPSQSSRSSAGAKPPKTDLNVVIGKRCPQCKTGAIIRGRQAWGCDRWREGCHFVISFEMNGVLIPEEEAARLCVRRQSRLFHEVDQKKYRLELTADGGLKWAENQPKKATSKRGTTQKRGKQKSKTRRPSSSTAQRVKRPWSSSKS
jgi:DNA topoisomerase III